MKRLIAICILGMASMSAFAQNDCTALLQVEDQEGYPRIAEQFDYSDPQGSLENACNAALNACEQSLASGQYPYGTCELQFGEDGNEIFDPETIYDGSFYIEIQRHTCQVQLTAPDFRFGPRGERLGYRRPLHDFPGRGNTRATACRQGLRLCRAYKNAYYPNNIALTCDAPGYSIPRPVVIRPFPPIRPIRPCIPGAPGCMRPINPGGGGRVCIPGTPGCMRPLPGRGGGHGGRIDGVRRPEDRTRRPDRVGGGVNVHIRIPR